MEQIILLIGESHKGRLICPIGDALITFLFAYDGLGNRLRQITGAYAVNYVLDTAAGLSQVLTDGTNTYLYGLNRIAQGSTGEMGYYLGDALGSVRQMADATGELVLSRYYEPYGTAYNKMGSDSTAYGFTGEWTDGTGLVNLRARYYAPGEGRFVTKDSWQGNNKTPISYNGWLYGYENPIRWFDHTGFSPQVNCEDMPNYLNLSQLCRIGNGDDNDPKVLDARERIFEIMVLGGKIYGEFDEGYEWASKMLDHFLNGNGSQVDIVFPPFNKFSMDSGIRRAIDLEIGPRVPGDEPNTIKPLILVLIDKMKEDVKNDGMINLSIQLSGVDYYSPKGTFPRPYGTGFWAAFGHVAIDGDFSALGYYSCKAGGFLIDYSADYIIKDVYDWVKGKKTPFTFPFASTPILIPHEWELSLVNSNPPRANIFKFTISWNERERVFTSNFINFRRASSWEQ